MVLEAAARPAEGRRRRRKSKGAGEKDGVELTVGVVANIIGIHADDIPVGGVIPSGAVDAAADGADHIINLALKN